MNIDFHAHILPAADHGSDGLQTSLRQLALAKRADIELLAATPHFYPRQEELSDFLARRKRTWEALCAALERTESAASSDVERRASSAAVGGFCREATKAAPALRVGAEVQLCRSLHHMDGLEALCLAGTRVLLLELPADFSIRTYEQTLDGLLYERRLTVVLAHIDRYRADTVDFLLEWGFLAQLNASAFCHFRTRKQALCWAQSSRVVALGSDLHGAEMGYAEFLRARQRLGESYDSLMTRTAALLSENAC